MIRARAHFTGPLPREAKVEACGDEEEADVQTAIATVSLSGTLNEKLEAIAKAQFRGVEMFENDLLSAEFKARVAMAALSGEKTLAELSAEFSRSRKLSP